MSVLKRRSYLPAEQRREQILEVAKHTFARRGYHRTNIANICSGARVARGTVYQHFENKRAILIALLEGVVDRMVKLLEGRTPLAAMKLDLAKIDAAGVLGFCERRTRELLDAIFVDEPTLRLVLRESRGLDGVVDKVVARIDIGVLGAMEADIYQAQQLGILRLGDPEMYARYCLGGIEKIILLALLRDEPIDLEKVVRQTVQLQLFGLLAESVPGQSASPPAKPRGGRR